MICLNRIRNALLSVTPEVYHFHAHKPKAPYIVWAEDGQGDTVFANGRMQNQAIAGTVDLFTDKPEDMALFDQVQEALDGVCAWRLNSVQYEDDTGLTHYEWAWEIASDGLWPADARAVVDAAGGNDARGAKNG